MNALLATPHPLPTALDQTPSERPHRRHRIDQFDLDASQVDRFNELLARLGRQQAPLDCDQLATAARELRGRGSASPAPLCIVVRLRRVSALAHLVGDAGWQPANDAVDAAALVLAYVRDESGLIPNRLPTIGRLDDAIVVDTAWPRLSDEVESYLDYRRLRRVEAALRGVGRTIPGFSRADWELARRAEAALSAHQRRVRQSCYVSGAAPLFRIH